MKSGCYVFLQTSSENNQRFIENLSKMIDFFFGIKITNLLSNFNIKPKLSKLASFMQSYNYQYD